MSPSVPEMEGMLCVRGACLFLRMSRDTDGIYAPYILPALSGESYRPYGVRVMSIVVTLKQEREREKKTIIIACHT